MKTSNALRGLTTLAALSTAAYAASQCNIEENEGGGFDYTIDMYSIPEEDGPALCDALWAAQDAFDPCTPASGGVCEVTPTTEVNVTSYFLWQFSTESDCTGFLTENVWYAATANQYEPIYCTDPGSLPNWPF